MDLRLARRLVLMLMVVPLLALAACGSNGGLSGGGKVVIVGQQFTEADVMTQMYKQLLDKAGFKTQVKNLGARDVYINPLKKNQVQVSADYLSSMTEDLNRRVNGDKAKPVASADQQATLAQLTKLGKKFDMTPLQPAKAQDANAFAVTKKFAQAHNLKTLSDLAKLGMGIKLAAASDCPTRPECKIGLQNKYGIKITSVEPTGFGTADTKNDLAKGVVQLGQVGTTDGTLNKLGLVILSDNLHLQNAENLVPIVNSTWLTKNPKAKDALNKLASVLTTADLTALAVKVDQNREQASKVAQDYLKQKGLI